MIDSKDMAGCGYVCPVCEGSGTDEKGNSCSWCTPMERNAIKQEILDDPTEENPAVDKPSSQEINNS